MPPRRLDRERHAVAMRLGGGNRRSPLLLSLVTCVASDCKTNPRGPASHKQIDTIPQLWFWGYRANVRMTPSAAAFRNSGFGVT
jgi:hypothetical protein